MRGHERKNSNEVRRDRKDKPGRPYAAGLVFLDEHTHGATRNPPP